MRARVDVVHARVVRLRRVLHALELQREQLRPHLDVLRARLLPQPLRRAEHLAHVRAHGADVLADGRRREAPPLLLDRLHLVRVGLLLGEEERRVLVVHRRHVGDVLEPRLVEEVARARLDERDRAELVRHRVARLRAAGSRSAASSSIRPSSSRSATHVHSRSSRRA